MRPFHVPDPPVRRAKKDRNSPPPREVPNTPAETEHSPADPTPQRPHRRLAHAVPPAQPAKRSGPAWSAAPRSIGAAVRAGYTGAAAKIRRPGREPPLGLCSPQASFEPEGFVAPLAAQPPIRRSSATKCAARGSAGNSSPDRRPRASGNVYRSPCRRRRSRRKRRTECRTPASAVGAGCRNDS